MLPAIVGSSHTRLPRGLLWAPPVTDPMGARAGTCSRGSVLVHWSPTNGGSDVSKTSSSKTVTPSAIKARKGGPAIVCLTSYSAPMAKLVDPHADLILVGDSVAMTIYGMTSTVGVTQE